MTTLRVGVLSAAHGHSGGFAKRADRQPDVELVGIADDNETRGRQFADEFDIPFLASDELLQKVDAVGVFSHTVDHDRWITAAADAGVDVLSEKPLATTAEEAASIADYCDANEITLGMALPIRFNEVLREAGRQLDQGAIGTLQSIIGTNLVTLPGRDWAFDPDANGGGAIVDHTVHVLNTVRAITGEEVVEVYAEAGTRFSDGPVEDVNLLSMELSDGTLFTHDGSWSRPDNWHNRSKVTLKLIGTEGIISADGYARGHMGVNGATAEYSFNNFGTDHNTRMIRDFIDAVKEGRSPSTTGRDGVREAAVVEAAYESLERGVPITVEV